MKNRVWNNLQNVLSHPFHFYIISVAAALTSKTIDY